MWLTLVGGVGVFLVGMTMLTEGLKVAAGGALRGILARFTRNRFSAVASGALVTGLVQSSTATTLATIGFVSAGLLTFPQALGVIFGANVGTTSTGWLVSLVGFKLDVTVMAFPVIALGGAGMLLTEGSKAAASRALAGFGLIFVGIDFMQEGMASLAEDIDPGTFQGETLHGRVLLVLIGIVMTVLLQSSSAAVATTLTALNAGAIDMNEAAALVIGQNLGTTVTAGVAAIGASLAAKRTALAHVLFNGMTGVVALAALPLFVSLSRDIAEGDPAISLAAFHTLFNVAGVFILLPVVGRFSRLVERMLPERAPDLAGYLDDTVLDVPAIAIDAARRTIARIAEVALANLHESTGGEARSRTRDPDLAAALDLQRFVGRISPSTEEERVRYLGVLHAFDHLHQLRALAEGAPPASLLAHFPEQLDLARSELALVRDWLAGDGTGPLPAGIEPAARELAGWRIRRRREVLEERASSNGEHGPEDEPMTHRIGGWLRLRRDPPPGRLTQVPAQAPIVEQLDAMLWLARLGHHTWRLAWHTAVAAGQRLEGEPPVAFDPA